MSMPSSSDAAGERVEDDFKKQHTPEWWRELFAGSGLLEVEYCAHLDDADVLYEEMMRYEYERNTDPFDVQICSAAKGMGA